MAHVDGPKQSTSQRIQEPEKMALGSPVTRASASPCRAGRQSHPETGVEEPLRPHSCSFSYQRPDAR
eukprot:2983123-Pyramimonas_sp.AAC.1